MKKVIILSLFVLVCYAYGENISIEKLRASSFNIPQLKTVKVDLPAVKVLKVVKEETSNNVSQDVVYKFNRVKDDIYRIKSDTTWLRNDMNRLLNDARRIASTSQPNSWFSYDLRDISYKLSRWYNDIDRISWDIKELLKLASKDSQLNSISKDIDFYMWDIENVFDFSLENTARDLEFTVRNIDPKLVGYDAQWNAYDISRYVRDISSKVRDMRWDIRDLVNKTQP